ncbi:MAG: hypothetical protein QE271_10360 [Bacteriovoracaceae bacterium]|nr:hypothetical protein [Bacteriovoracaceae bacterium]
MKKTDLPTNFHLIISYFGTNFQGVIKQPHLLTIGEELKIILEQNGWERISLHFTSRTDAGVHAEQNFIQLHVKQRVGELDVSLLNLQLPTHLRIISLFENREFQAITPKLEKTYQYFFSHSLNILSSPLKEHVLYWQESLDIGLMKKVATDFLGEHNFLLYQRGESKRARENALRTIEKSILYELDGSKEDNQIFVFEVTSMGFMRNMVRYMVGALINVGQGKISRDLILKSLSWNLSSDIVVPGFCVPPEGLKLKSIKQKI